MEKLAAIDVGSNAIRLVIGTVKGNRVKTQWTKRVSIRLGEDVFQQGSISEKKTRGIIRAFRKFLMLLDKEEVARLRVVGTSAVREAENRKEFLMRVTRQSGISITPINIEQEARYIFLSVCERVNLKKKTALLIDIGGGSVEVTLVRRGKILAYTSFQMGAVRLLQLIKQNKLQEWQLYHFLVSACADTIKRMLRRHLGGSKVDLCIGTGGNVESLCQLVRKFHSSGFSASKTVLTKQGLWFAIGLLQRLSVKERVRKLGLRPDRADVILPAALVLDMFINEIGVKKVIVPYVGLRNGLLLDMHAKLKEKINLQV